MRSEIDAFLDSLGEEARGSLRTLLGRAYERGFREGLSASGDAGRADQAERQLLRRAESSALGALGDAHPDPLPGPATEPPPPLHSMVAAYDERGIELENGSVDWDDADDENEETAEAGSEGVEAAAPRPISTRATIGTLLQRIERTFALDRFEVDVVVCLRGDKNRRQLKRNVALHRYLRAR